MKNFNIKQLRVMTEIYRRLNYFQHGKEDQLTTKHLITLFPSEVKVVESLGIIKCHDSTYVPKPRIYVWYMLTDKGRVFFSNYIEKDRLSEDRNREYYEGKIKKFDPKHLYIN